MPFVSHSKPPIYEQLKQSIMSLNIDAETARKVIALISRDLDYDSASSHVPTINAMQYAHAWLMFDAYMYPYN